MMKFKISKEKNMQQKSSEFFYFVLVIFFVVSIYLLYLFTLGVPKTQARNLYLKAQERLKIGDVDGYLNYMKKSLSYYQEEYILSELEKNTKKHQLNISNDNI